MQAVVRTGIVWMVGALLGGATPPSGLSATAALTQAANRADRSDRSGHTATDTALPAPGIPFSADTLTSLLPATVYFQGRSAPLQLRNAGGTTFAEGAIVWVSLVDSSGYSTSVQERYQFYLVTEGPLQFGSVSLRPGAYGGGFVGDRFLVMDLGGHTIGEGATQTDNGMQRPRPLQVRADQPMSVRLYLGRRWVSLRPDPGASRTP